MYDPLPDVPFNTGCPRDWECYDTAEGFRQRLDSKNDLRRQFYALEATLSAQLHLPTCTVQFHCCAALESDRAVLDHAESSTSFSNLLLFIALLRPCTETSCSCTSLTELLYLRALNTQLRMPTEQVEAH